MPQPILSFENAGWVSQIILAIFFVAGGVGTFFGYHNGKRAGISERTRQTIEELESLTGALASAVDELEKSNARKDKKIEFLEAKVHRLETAIKKFAINTLLEPEGEIPE